MKEILVETLSQLDSVKIINENNIQHETTKYLISSVVEGKVNVIDFEAYDTYGQEINKNTDFIIGDKLVINETQSFDVINVQEDYIEVIGSLEDVILFSTVVYKQSYENKNTLLIEGLHSFNKRENNNLSVKLERFDLILTVYNDYEGYIAEELQNKISILLSRNLYSKKRKKTIYIDSSLNFEILHNNKDNKVLRGTIMLKEYKN